MAIYTKLDKEKISSILSNYELGNIKKFEGIKEGIENTNYSVETEKGKYILTIYEKRVNKNDLPFFSKLMLGLSKNNFICPEPIPDKENKYISNFQSRNVSHLFRYKNQAILITVKTANIDNPMLTCRLSGLEKYSPARILLDKNPIDLAAGLRLANVLNEKGEDQAAISLIDKLIDNGNTTISTLLMKLKLSLFIKTPSELGHQVDEILNQVENINE